MGTEATVTFHNVNHACEPEAIATLCITHDGYWVGAGRDIAKTLERCAPFAYTANNLAAMVVAALVIDVGKREPGRYHLYAKPCPRQQYHYDIIAMDGGWVELVAFIGDEMKFRGTPTAFLNANEAHP